ncbi:MAG: response regulator [Anaerolineae bacterium]|nr:response regulator [Anaerolineae bacterium]MDW8099582.1 response regulator [Anaerolineae bacterium]
MAKRILVIDDEPELIQLLSFFLCKAGFEVYGAHDGPQALAMLEQTMPDLVVCDMVMPTMDGVAIVQALRAHAYGRSLPILMLSARGRTDDVERALAAGANDYITKPFRGSEVIAIIEKHLSEVKSDEQSHHT